MTISTLTCLYLFGCAAKQVSVEDSKPDFLADTTETGEVEPELELGTIAETQGGSNQLTAGEFHNGLASFHPDGEHLVFQSNRDGRWQIYELTLLDNSVGRVFESNYNDEHPVWMPDGSKLLFVSDRDSDGKEWARNIYSYDPATEAIERLTDSPADDWYPVPLDAESFVFLSEREADSELDVYYRQNSMYIGFISEGDAIKIAGAELDPSSPTQWGEDRFIVRSHTGSLSIWLADGSLERITPTKLICGGATVYPDKGWMVFSARTDGPYKLFLMDLNSRTLQEIESLGDEVRYPKFSPDGSAIIYTADINGLFQICQLQLESE